MATPQDAITLARTLLDNPIDIYDSQFLSYANDAFDEIALIRQELFHSSFEFTCAVNATFQTFSSADSIRVVDIHAVKNGNAVRRISRSELDALKPSWHTDAAAPAEHWISLDLEFSNSFLIYPKAPNSQILTGLYVKSPPEYTLTQTHSLPASFTPVIANYIIGKHLSRPSMVKVDPNAMARSQAAMASFYSSLGASAPEVK